MGITSNEFQMKGLHVAQNNRRDINCGGYALGTKFWENLDGWRGTFKVELIGDAASLNLHRVFLHLPSVSDTLEKNFNLELVGIFTPEEAEDHYRSNLGDYLLFRHTDPKCGYDDCDFHFKNITKRGEVYHKPGGSPALKHRFTRDTFSEVWPGPDGGYKSEILMMRWTGPKGHKA